MRRDPGTGEEIPWPALDEECERFAMHREDAPPSLDSVDGGIAAGRDLRGRWFSHTHKSYHVVSGWREHCEDSDMVVLSLMGMGGEEFDVEYEMSADRLIWGLGEVWTRAHD